MFIIHLLISGECQELVQLLLVVVEEMMTFSVCGTIKESYILNHTIAYFQLLMKLNSLVYTLTINYLFYLI